MSEILDDYAALQDTKLKLERATLANEARHWLEECSADTWKDVDWQSINATININWGSAARGSEEAAEYMRLAAQHYMADIGRCALAMARRDVAVGEAIVNAAKAVVP